MIKKLWKLALAALGTAALIFGGISLAYQEAKDR